MVRPRLPEQHTEDRRIAEIKPRNTAQKNYLHSMYKKAITFASGAAGTGKTLLALKTAIEMHRGANNPIERIIIIRNLTDSFGESMGAVPGEIEDKMAVLHGPLLDNLRAFLPEGYIKQLMTGGAIEVIPLSFLRGRSLNNSFILADELSSVSREAMRLIITRLGENSRLVLCGDPMQKCGSVNDGFTWGREVLRDSGDVGVIDFCNADVQRNEVLPEIMDLLDSHIGNPEASEAAGPTLEEFLANSAGSPAL